MNANDNQKVSPDQASLERSLRASLSDWEKRDLARQLPSSRPENNRVDFVSNDYLGLANHEKVKAAAAEAAREYGAGGKASRLLGGGCDLHRDLETLAAAWLQCDSTLLFSSGYQANLGALAPLLSQGDVLLSDSQNHASIIDAARLSRARVEIYRHLDMAHLEEKLHGCRSARYRLIATESVFSMDGDLAPLPAILELCEKFDAFLVVDEAHATGILGPEGAGAVAGLGEGATRHRRLLARIITGGKALGVAGALVAGSQTLTHHLINRSRPFVFSTAPPPAVAGALIAAVEITREAGDLREKVLLNARRFATQLDLPLPDAAIIPVLLGKENLALQAAEKCQEEGFDLRAVRPPTVSPGTSRLRVTSHAFNESADFDRLVKILSPLVPEQMPVEAISRKAESLFVVGTDTGVGKTVVSAILLHAARSYRPVRYWKPVQTGDESDSTSIQHLTKATAEEILPPLHEYPLPASPHEAAAHAGNTIDPTELSRTFKEHRSNHPDSLLLVEPAGGLLVPYTINWTTADWIAREGAATVVVARSGLGTLNHTLLTVSELRKRGLEPRALFLVGPPHPSNRNTLSRMTAIPIIYELPMLETLNAGTLQEWIETQDFEELLAS